MVLTRCLKLFMLMALLLSGTAHAVSAAMQNNINALRNSGKSGVVLQQMVLQRAAGIAPHNRPYRFDGVGDCYGYVRQVWNAILHDGNVHSEDFYPRSYNKSRWHNVAGGVPVGDAVSGDWVRFTHPDQLLPGDILSTHQGHAWGAQWHGGIYAGKENGVYKQWDSGTSGTSGAYKRNLYSGFRYYYRPLHDLLRPSATPPPAAGGYPEYPGIYRLIARNSGKALDVQGGGTANGVNVWQWDINGHNAQHWEIQHVSNGLYRLRNVNSGKYLGAENGGTTNGTNVRQWEWTGNCGHLWRIEHAPDGHVRLVSHCSGKVLDVEGGINAIHAGANVHIWDNFNHSNQQWRLDALPHTYRLIVRHSGKALDVAYGGTADGTNVWQWGVNSVNGGAAQKWVIKHEGEGYFSFRNPHSGKFLGAENGGTVNGTNVRLWSWTGNCGHLWRIIGAGDGHYRLVSKCGGRVVDVDGGISAKHDGANVHLWDYFGNDNQRWRFVPAN